MTTKGLAHGKVILIGEHAVVYGHQAIALPLLHATVEVECTASTLATFKSDVYKGLLSEAPKTLSPIVSLILALTAELNLPTLSFTVHSKLYSEAGLGSSAAVASAIVEAMFNYSKTPLNKEERFKWVQYSETLAHTNPSGIDAHVTNEQHAIVFSKGAAIKPLDINLDAVLVIGYTGVKGQTKKAVEKIAKTLNNPLQENLMNALGNTSLEALDAVKQNNTVALGTMLDKAHTILSKFGVSHTELDHFVGEAKKHGALGAKLTGGGLGGCAIALFDNKDAAQTFETFWQKTTNLPTWTLSLKR